MKNTNTVATTAKDLKPATEYGSLLFFPAGFALNFLNSWAFPESGGIGVIIFTVLSMVLYSIGWSGVFRWMRSYREIYKSELSGLTNEHTDDRVLHAFKQKYKSPLSRWSMNFFGREGERILLSKYAVPEPRPESVRYLTHRDVKAGSVIALKAEDNTSYGEHPYVLENYLVMTSKGLKVEQETTVNPLTLWDSALKDVSEQYNLDTYFTAKQKKADEEKALAVKSQNLAITGKKTEAQKQVEAVMSAFEGLTGKNFLDQVSVEKRKFEKQAERIRKNHELAVDLGLQ